MSIEDYLVSWLNTLGKGSTPGSVESLLLTPAQYNAGLYQATVSLHETAVKPISAVILSIMAVTSLAAISARMDQGDNEMGVRMVFVSMFQILMAIVVTENAMKILQALDGIAVWLATAANGVNVGAMPQGQALGDVLRPKIAEADVTQQLFIGIILFLPWLFTKIVDVLVIVVIFYRFLKIDVLTAFASLPIAFGAMEATRPMAIGYLKRYGEVALQAAIIIISLKLYEALMATWVATGLTVDANADLVTVIADHMGKFLVAPAVLATLVFSSSSIARAVIGD